MLMISHSSSYNDKQMNKQKKTHDNNKLERKIAIATEGIIDHVVRKLRRLEGKGKGKGKGREEEVEDI
jgi:hypothetical protein